MNKELREKELKAIAISPEGNYGVYRQLFNIDIPQDITNFRQIQEAINTVEKDIEKQREKFYYKDEFTTDEVLKKTNGVINVKDFIPTAGIVRIDLGNDEKLDVLITYPLDKIEEGKNVFLIGKGKEREDIEGELLYHEDLRDKKLNEIKLSEGITLDEFKEIFKQIKEKALFRDLKEALGIENIELEDLEDRELVEELLEKIKEKAEEDKEIKEKLELAGLKDFKLTLTVKELLEELIEKRRLEGRVHNIKTEFYPVNGIIMGETNDKELVMVFSPQRLDWTIKGIGIAQLLNQDLNYKIGNSLLTILQSPTAERIIIGSKKVDEEDVEKLKGKIKAKIEQMRDLEKNYGEKLDDRLFEIANKVLIGIETNKTEYIKKARELLREWRDRKIMQVIDKPRIDVNDILKPHKEKVKEGKEVKYVKTDKKFLRWDLTDLQTPLGFYKNLYDAVKLRGEIFKRENGEKVYYNNVKMFFVQETRIIPDTNPQKPQFKINNVLKPVAFTKLSYSITSKRDFGLYGFLIRGQQNLDKVEAKNLADFLEKWKEENKVSIYLNRGSVKVNENWDKYLAGFVLLLKRNLEASKMKLEEFKKELNKKEIDEKVLKQKLNNYLDTLGGGVRREYIGLGKLRERFSEFKQGVVFENFLKHNIENKVKPLAMKLITAIDTKDYEWAKEIVEKIEEVYIKGDIGKLISYVKKADKFNEEVLENIEKSNRTVNKLNQIIEKLQQKQQLDLEEKMVLRTILKNSLQNIWLNNVRAEGLITLMKSENFKNFPEEDKELIRKELNNKIAIERIANAVAGKIKTTMVDRILSAKIRREEKYQIAVDNLKAKQEERINKMPEIIINLEEIENIKEIDVKREAKGEPFLANNEGQLKEKILKVIENIDSKLGGLLKEYDAVKKVEVSPAYRLKEVNNFTWNIKLTIVDKIGEENKEKTITYKPPLTTIPSIESISQRILKSEELKNYRELAKAVKKEKEKEVKVQIENENEDKITQKKQKNQSRKPRP